MKRLRTYGALVVALLLASSCGSGSTPPPSTESTSPAAATGDEPNLENAIWFVKNDGHDSAVTAACIGTATTYKMSGQRKHKVRWHLENDPYNKCDGFQTRDVELRFNAKIWEQDTDILTPNGGSANVDGKVRKESGIVADGTYKYVIYYKGLPASPDPEIDIAGDCGGCALP